MSSDRKPRAIVFDLGKVLVDFDYSIAGRKLAARATMASAELGSFIISVPLIIQYETGLISSQQFYDEVRAATGFLGDLEEFAGLFADIFSPIEPMIRLHDTLRKTGFPTYIFSNTNEFAIRFVRKNFPFFANFNDYILSYEHQSMKPDSRLYRVVEERCGFSGKDILYIDDRPENIEAGAARGWQVILQTSPAKTLEAVQKLKLLDRPS